MLLKRWLCANLQEMSTADLRSYYEKWERPDNAVLGICGDFDTNHMVRARIETRKPSYAHNVAFHLLIHLKHSAKVFITLYWHLEISVVMNRSQGYNA